MTENTQDTTAIEEVRAAVAAAKKASTALAATTTAQRNSALLGMAQALRANASAILEANAADVSAAEEKGTAAGLIDRLLLTNERIEGMAAALEELVALPDPVGEVVDGRTIQAGVRLTTIRQPLGVVAIIYEARPNVTADAAGLCIKTANACVLKGGSLAQRSNLSIGEALSRAACEAGLPSGCIQVIASTSREATGELMALRDCIDVLIPRGGAGLIKSCVQNSKVPVIETGMGNCHLYVHEKADYDKALGILINAKCQRVGVCNAIETLLIDKAVASEMLPGFANALAQHGVTLRCDDISHKCIEALEGGAAVGDAAAGGGKPVLLEHATEDDWATEYLDYTIAIKVVGGLDEAIAHINRYGTGHSEAIVSEDYSACERFLAQVDAAAVYANASTRFTDGGVFGLGAEIGISTQKLHARGPMGLVALTTTKSILRGDGQVRS